MCVCVCVMFNVLTRWRLGRLTDPTLVQRVAWVTMLVVDVSDFVCMVVVSVARDVDLIWNVRRRSFASLLSLPLTYQ